MNGSETESGMKRPMGGSALAESIDQMRSGIEQIYDDGQRLLLIQDQHGKMAKALAQSLDMLLTGLEDQKKDQALNTEVRETVVQCAREVHNDTHQLISHIEGLLPQLIPAPPEATTWQQWAIQAAGVLIGAALIGTLWWIWPASRYERFAVALDSAVVQTYGQLPKGAQDDLARLYLRYGIEPPGTRQKKGGK